MNTYIFTLKDNLGEVKVDAANRICAMEIFVEMGYNPHDVEKVEFDFEE